MLNIVMPLAGTSELFQQSGYLYPKPLIEINGKLMIEVVLENLRAIRNNRKFTFIIKEEDCLSFHLDNTLKLLVPECHITVLKKPAQGALCSVLMAMDSMEEAEELVVVNGDQVLDIDFNTVLEDFRKKNAQAAVVTFSSVHPRWSYARIENGEVVQTAEKNPISKNAIAGVYYFQKAEELFDAAAQVLLCDQTTNGNFFISSAINQYVLSNKKVSHFEIRPDQYHSFYSPQMLQEYEMNSRK